MTPSKITKELSSLSLMEIITLQKLLEHQDVLVRFVLYQEVSQLINSGIKDHPNTEDILSDSLMSPKLATSSFYNSLKSLEARGLISYNYSKKGKIETVQATPKAKTALSIISQYFLSSIPSDSEISQAIGEEILKRISQTRFKSFLIVWLSDVVRLNIITLLSNLGEELYFLSKVQVFNNLKKMGYDKLKFIKMYGNIIREPKDIFDVTVIPNYVKDLDFFGLTRMDLLKEVIRIMKKEGIVILIVRQEFSNGENFFISEIIKIYNESIKNHIFSEQELETDMKKSGLAEVEIFMHKGLIVGIGKAP